MQKTTLSPDSKPSGTATPEPLNPGRRILVVDDEPLIRKINLEILVDAGYQVDTAEDGATAWDALQQNDYDLLVTDNQMPEVSGLELMGKMRDASMKLPVIMATATLPEKELLFRCRCNFLVLLLKPYSLVELVETVKAVLESARNGVGPVSLVPNWESQPLAFGARLN